MFFDCALKSSRSPHLSQQGGHVHVPDDDVVRGRLRRRRRGRVADRRGRHVHVRRLRLAVQGDRLLPARAAGLLAGAVAALALVQMAVEKT